MPTQLQDLLAFLQAESTTHLLTQGHKGLEKEGLRYNIDNTLASTPHPAYLGHPLTHDNVTTDYAESLLELVTPAFASNQQTEDYLRYLHRLIANNAEEYMLNGSIPAYIKDPEAVEVGYYGTSNPGKMRRLYRKGLALRYGKAMQLIAGIHYNYSIHNDLWLPLAAFYERQVNRQFIDEMYMNLVRNIRIHAWVIPYLFGHSPAIDKSFFQTIPDHLQSIDNDTLCLPYATSLRASDIGYQNKTSSLVGSNTLAQYIENLRNAVLTPSATFAEFGLKSNSGEYQQINTNLLQIENEYYTVARAKQIAKSGESPIKALKARGITYVELRTLDINCFADIGVDSEQLDFLEIYMLYNLFNPAPLLDKAGEAECEKNTSLSACCGRNPRLTLRRNGKPILLRDWGKEFIDKLRLFTPYLENSAHYDAILDKMQTRFADPATTPSANIMDILEQGKSYHQFITELSVKHHNKLHKEGLTEQEKADSKAFADQSIADEKALVKKNKDLSFDDYLAQYFTQLVNL